MNTDYCNHCHGEGYYLTKIGNKPVKCDECCGTGRATGAYTQPPKVNGWNVKRVIEFAFACLALVVAFVAMGVLKLIGKEV